MRFIRFTLLISVISVQAGCCQLNARKEPAFQGKYQIWEEVRGSGFTVLGNFTLSKGESTDNGRIGIKLVDVTLPKCMSPFAEPPQPVVVIQLYDPRNGKSLCEKRFLGGGGDFYDSCGPDRYTVDFHAINTKDSWVTLDLRRIEL